MLNVTKVAIGADRKPVASFTLSDEKGGPLALTDLDGNPSFLLAYLKTEAGTGLTQYVNYVTSQRAGAAYTKDGETRQPALAQATQAGLASGGAFASLGDGSFTYTFKDPLPEGYDTAATHTLGAYATRAARQWVSNDTLDFVPSGAAVSVTRQVVNVDNCNTCHGDLALHGGTRRDTRVCVLCHTPQSVDPESGNTVDFKVMVHKIHKGELLHSVEEGGRYYIVGYRQGVHDWSEQTWPQDVRNCTKCHSEAPNADNYKAKPNAAACGSCHDEVNFATGANHPGGAQPTDAACALCHGAETGLAPVTVAHKYDLSTPLTVELAMGAPANGKYYVAGETPSVAVTIKDAATGAAIDPSTITEAAWNRAYLFASGPRAYTVPVLTTKAANPGTSSYASNEIRLRTDPANEDPRLSRSATAITYQLADVADLASGTYTVFVQARKLSTDATSVALLNFQVGTATVEPMVATNCADCHGNSLMHGSYPFSLAPDVCKNCHDYLNQLPDRVSWNNNNWGYGAAPISRRVHGVHFGSSLDKPLEVYGNPARFDASKITFPQDVRNCTKCHSETATYNSNPNRLACLACHDTDAAIVHGATMTIDPTTAQPYGGDEKEACAVCHGAGRDFEPIKVHAIN